MTWRDELSQDFLLAVSSYLSGDEARRRLAVIDACSILTHAFRRYLTNDVAENPPENLPTDTLKAIQRIPKNITLLELVEQYRDLLNVDRNDTAEFKSLNRFA